MKKIFLFSILFCLQLVFGQNIPFSKTKEQHFSVVDTANVTLTVLQREPGYIYGFKYENKPYTHQLMLNPAETDINEQAERTKKMMQEQISKDLNPMILDTETSKNMMFFDSEGEFIIGFCLTKTPHYLYQQMLYHPLALHKIQLKKEKPKENIILDYKKINYDIMHKLFSNIKFDK
ncbi:hypothetical protein [Chryseobacterium oryctis]|uniref:Uncharacterized protein n=1 Tax=Chryseobacterium oryctis TaxID=2952618 RepID=A0ABT3HIT4_9FLAO|nr:hypothetical protein [Chryseobacterium oryctis]MCW3159694.1 hypothetical protein [Chryseobacterium oryctis]